MPQALAKQALERGADVFGGYGMSETCPLLSLAQLKPPMREWSMEQQLEVRCKAGLPMPLVELRIVDAEMNDLPHDGVSQGEVVARAPWLTQGYLKDPKNSEALWQGGYLHTGDIGTIDIKISFGSKLSVGYLHTGDIGTIDPEGYLKITDRIKDVIKTGGEWISSLDLEDLILTHPGVAEAAVIGVPDAKWGERPMALVVQKPGQTVDVGSLRALLMGYAEKGIISKYGVPEQILFVETIAKTSVGKLNKKELRTQYVE